MGSVTLYTTAWGNYWEEYGKQWEKNVKGLEYKPDRVFLISDKEIDSEFEVILTEVPKKAILSHFRNVAVDNANTDWLVCADLDDVVYPWFIENLNDDYDIHSFTFDRTGGGWGIGDKTEWDNLFKAPYYHNFVLASSSAIKVQAIKDCGMYPEIEYEDAGLWCKMRKAERSIFFDSKPRYLYSDHGVGLSRGNTTHKSIELEKYLIEIKKS
jgi:hypothetical protein